MAGVLDALASYIQNMLSEMAKEEVKLLLGVPNELVKMDIKLGDLRRFLADADKRNITDESVQSWVKELRNAMYDATDILDLCQLKAMERGPSRDMGCLNPLLFCMMNPLHAHGIGSRIKKLNEKLDDIEKRSKAFNFVNLASYDNAAEKAESSRCNRRETTGEEEIGLVGEKIEEDTRNLVELLTRNEKNIHEYNKIMVFAIVGVGGIGKTTLAKKIFNNDIIKQEFPKRVWLSVNKQFSHDDLIGRAITEAHGDHQAARNTKASLERTLKEALEGCKTLLVMDDVWNHQAWEMVLEPPLRNSLAQGSRVLVTTRHTTVARGMMAKVPYHHVAKLEQDDAWILLKKQVVGYGSNDEHKVDTLKDIGMRILSKCDGLPIAVKVMGGLLRQRKTRRSEWENVLNDSIWSVTQMPDELNYAVYISYQDLHPNLKACFLHYALLPKSVVFFVDRIIAMWISEGFVHGNSCDLEVSGRKYYDELIARNLIEPDRYVDQSVCNMHDVIRSFAQYMTRDEALIIAPNCEVSLTSKPNSQNIFRLSLETKEAETNEIRWISLQPYISLRTLVLVGEIKINPGESLLCFPCLRILHVEDGSFDALSESLVQLKHLRYLSIDCTDTSRLPENITKMKFLQHIIIRNCENLEKLPSGIGKLQQLRFLDLRYTGIKNVPRGFDGLTNLRKLYGFPAHMDGDWCSLEQLGPLPHLMELSISYLENVPSSLYSIKARLAKKVRLSYLALVCSNRSGDGHRLEKEEAQHQIQAVFDELCPPPSLEYLTINGYFGQQLPRWMTSTATAPLGSLRFLVMEDLPYCMEIPDGLCQLPDLEVVQIKGAPAITHIGPEYLLPHCHEHSTATENIGFDFKIVRECPNLERISSLPNLQNLVIILCPKLKVLEGLPSLQRLVLEDYGMETLPTYLRDVKPRHLLIDCSLPLLTCIAAGKSSPEWGKFNHIQQVKAYADEGRCQRKWYVLFRRDPFRFETNICRSTIAKAREARALFPYSETCPVEEEEEWAVGGGHASEDKRYPLCGRFRWQAYDHLVFWLRKTCLHCCEAAGIASMSDQWTETPTYRACRGILF